jgi:hypothetical protein
VVFPATLANVNIPANPVGADNPAGVLIESEEDPDGGGLQETTRMLPVCKKNENVGAVMGTTVITADIALAIEPAIA